MLTVKLRKLGTCLVLTVPQAIVHGAALKAGQSFAVIGVPSRTRVQLHFAYTRAPKKARR
jgi:hypothetical protein